MESFLFNNAPAVILASMVAYFLIRLFCPKKEDVITKSDFNGQSKRIDSVAEKVSENDKSTAVQIAEQRRIILEDASAKFSSKDTVSEIRTDFNKFENSVNSRFEKLDEKIDLKFYCLDKKIDEKFENLREEIIDILKK